MKGLSKTGIPLFLLFVVVVVAVVYVETILLDRTEDLVSISLSENATEEYEINEAIKNEGEVDQRLLLEASNNPYRDTIVQLVKAGGIEGDIGLGLKEKGIPRNELTEAIVTYFYLLIKHKRYEQVVTVLAKQSIAQRNREGTQFYYALALSKKGNHKQSLAEYKVLISKNVNHQSATLNSAMILLKMERYQESLRYFSKANEITSGIRKSKSLAGMARCYRYLGENERAIELYKKSIEYRPSYSKTWRLLADVMAQNNHAYQTVVSTYNKALALNSEYSLVIKNKSQYQLEKMDYHGAIDSVTGKLPAGYDKGDALRINVWALLELGLRSSALRATKKLNSYEDTNPTAESDILHRYLKKDYDYTDDYLNKSAWENLTPSLLYLHALANIKQHKTGVAKEQLVVLQSNPQFGDRAKIAEATLHKKKKRYRQALAIYQAVMAANIQATNLWYETSKLHAKLGNHQQALDSIQIAIDRQPNNKQYLLVKSDYLVGLNNTTQAIVLLEAVHQSYPRSIKTLERLLSVLLDSGRLDLAQKYLVTLIERDSENLEALMNLAGVQYQLKSYFAAKKTLTNILEIQQNHIQARFLSANVSLKLGDKAESISQLSQLLKLDGNHQPAIKLRDKLLLKQSAVRSISDSRYYLRRKA